MSLYERRILPWLIERACSITPIARQREALVPQAAGQVLEIGVGSGLNLPFYDPARVDRVIGLDISPELLRRAEARAADSGIAFTPLLLDAATIPLPAASVDTVLVTYALCSIADLGAALAEMKRVLKPEGRLIFCEHGRAPDRAVALVQDLVNPVWRPLAGGCHLNRDPLAELRAAGFTVERVDEGYLPMVWRPVGWTSWGVARIAG
ncbi:MAG: class I SAM-dependent methyltransferase [Rhodobacter sp.]|nr:class I SAM-dependent methyltransferase [Paracoccaceae bacterium]MCC0076682.1 class I SAM-dependent methyltransferase [Rhodobacter sp.]